MRALIRTILIAGALVLAAGVPTAPTARAAPPAAGPLSELLLPGFEPAPLHNPHVFRFALLSEGGRQIDTTRFETRIAEWAKPVLITLETVGIRSGRLQGTLVFHNGSGGPLFGVQLDFGLRIERYRGVDSAGKPRELIRSQDVERGTRLFLGDLARGEDTPPLPFDVGPVGFQEETISVEFQAALSGYRLQGVVTTADSIDVPAAMRSEGLDDTPRRVRAGELTQPARFSRCYCRVDSIAAMSADSRPLAAPPRVRAGAAPGGLNALVACDVDASDHVFVVDRNFAAADSSGAPLARISRFDAQGRFLTAWGWGAPDLAPPHLPLGRIREPEGLAVLSDGRVLVQQKARPRKLPEIMIFDPFPRQIPRVAPGAR